ncbi:recombinase family protein [Streptomyces sp. NPDC055059]
MSYREIADALEAEGILPKRGERWHAETVRRMLANATAPPAAHRVALGGPRNIRFPGPSGLFVTPLGGNSAGC